MHDHPNQPLLQSKINIAIGFFNLTRFACRQTLTIKQRMQILRHGFVPHCAKLLYNWLYNSAKIPTQSFNIEHPLSNKVYYV